MKKIIYNINGENYDINQVTEKFNISRMSFLRHLSEGKTPEEAVKKKTRVKTGKRLNNVWPESAMLDSNTTEYTESIFETALNALVENKVISDRNMKIYILYYRANMNHEEISEIYPMTRARMYKIISRINEAVNIYLQ